MKTFDERRKDVAEKLEHMKRRGKRRKWAVTGACVMLAAVAVAVLFTPYDTTPPETKAYADSPYYDVICKINELTYSPPTFNNLFDSITSGLGGSTMADADGWNTGAAAPNMGYDAENADSYVEVTDNQVAGVTEGDIFKRSTRYLYYLSGEELRIYDIQSEDTQAVGTYTVSNLVFGSEASQTGWSYGNGELEMYLSQDCGTVTVVMYYYDRNLGATTLIASLDVTDPEAVTAKNYLIFPGDLISTRMVEDQLLLTYNYRVNADRVDLDNLSTFVPSYGKHGEMTCVSAGDILCPEDANSARYTVICAMDSQTLEIQGSVALMSYSTELYVSENAIYATWTVTEKQDVTDSGYTSVTVTQITGVSYGETVALMGTVAVDGSVEDQYSMDEYEGYLRVVTSTVRRPVVTSSDKFGNSSATSFSTVRSASLYCVDLADWSIAALVEDFAPNGEEVSSVRFDGTAAYVCTAVTAELTDPVFFFDLSDLDNITWTDTGTIDGYSTSLIQLGNGFLMGIGYGDDWGLKIEVYEQWEDTVVSVDAWEEDVEFSLEYKAYFIDREQELVGLAILDYTDSEYAYLLLQFDGYSFHELARIPLETKALDRVRACMIDGSLYILSDGGLIREEIFQ